MRIADFYRVLSPPAKLLALWVGAFLLCRLALIIATWPLRGDATPALIAKALLVGLRFDLAVGVALTLPFALWLVLRAAPSVLERRIVTGLFGLLGVVVLFAAIAEVEFYKEFEMRFGPLVFEYFGKKEHNEIVLSMIWTGYPVVRWMLVVAALSGVLYWLGRRILDQGTGGATRSVRAVALFVWLAITALAIRGGIGPSPLRWGDAHFSRSTYANHMAANGAYLLYKTWESHRRNHPELAYWRTQISRDSAFAVVREITLNPGETLLKPGTYPLLRRSPPSQIALTRPKNVVVVMMESFSARLTGATGAAFGATPNFDVLAREGFLFDRAFSVGTHTAQGVFAVLCSFPNLPTYEGLMKHPAGAQPFLTLPAILEDQGYDTLFLYNGLFSWDNKEGFFRAHGVHRFIGRDDYPNPSFVDPTWGVSDQDVFERARQEFSTLAKSGKPFLGIVLTLSNHAPFNLPPVPGLKRIEGDDLQNHRLNGMHYADWALGEFMKKARSEPWFDETLFVFVGDHGYAVPPVLTEVNVLHMHVPLLFYGPKILPPGRRHTVASQLDIVPTILGLLGTGAMHQSFGRDLFSLRPDDPGHAYVKKSGDPWLGWIEGDTIVTAAPKLPPKLYTLDLGFPPAARERDDGKAAQLQASERQLKAFAATSITAIEDHLLAPKQGDAQAALAE
jgi:phosphoglycerol transferase MdoB-like AlkP superfamily enzyme